MDSESAASIYRKSRGETASRSDNCAATSLPEQARGCGPYRRPAVPSLLIKPEWRPLIGVPASTPIKTLPDSPPMRATNPPSAPFLLSAVPPVSFLPFQLVKLGITNVVPFSSRRENFVWRGRDSKGVRGGISSKGGVSGRPKCQLLKLNARQIRTSDVLYRCKCRRSTVLFFCNIFDL